jgi:hypothetical protein
MNALCVWSILGRRTVQDFKPIGIEAKRTDVLFENQLGLTPVESITQEFHIFR